ncbi:toxin-antitoxin system HicB family antitoxin [Phascolarctobacterium succinatutens]|uniref:toxin-antitoxin system HicB family antitoxin n=1 Tax=Phascolarctobacterium succinatutens TaxID=626940 RepID=UPI003078CC92
MALPKKPITAAQMAAAEEFISGKTQEPSITQPHTTLPNPKNEDKGKFVTYNATMPVEIHAAAKIAAIKRGISLKKYIIEAIEEKNIREK